MSIQKHIFLKRSCILLCMIVGMLLSYSSKAESFQQNKKTNTEQAKPKNKQQKKTEQKETNTKQDQKNRRKAANDAPIREEIQRYMGYEPILTERYMTIPYDITMNTNMQGGFVDTGYYLFMFLPVILLLGFTKKPFYGILIMLFSILYISVATTSAFSVKRKIQIKFIVPNIDNFINAVEFKDYPVSLACAYVYKGLYKIYMPIYRGLSKISGPKDQVTYPILATLFLLFFFVLQKRIRHLDKYKASLVYLLYFFCFIWLVLGSGIIWYGYLMLALGLVFLTRVLTNTQKSWLRKGVLGMFVFVSILWIMMGYVYRIANHAMVTPDTAKLLFDIPSVKYQTGVFDRNDVINTLLPGADKALEEINKNGETLVYRIGTFFPYFIYKNDKRILEDNQLAFFQKLTQQFQNRTSIAEALKASGYRYILVDLNTASIDKTPERSLEKKFMSFLGFLYNNDSIELLATNRVITLTPPDDPNPIYTHGVFGNIHSPGTYAIYRIK